MGCSANRERAAAYATASTSADTRADAVQGLNPAKSSEYPTLYYGSPGMRRLSDAQRY